MDYLLAALPVMGWGMLGTFLAVCAIAGVVAMLNQFTKEK